MLSKLLLSSFAVRLIASVCTVTFSGFKTEIYFSCGENDFLLSMNKDYAEHLKNLEIPHSFEMWEGIHNWKFWRESLDKALEK